MVKIGDIAVGDYPFLLAPMEDVSDPPFRALCKEEGADVVYTEFINADGLIRNARGTIEKLDIYPEERPVGIQIYGAHLEPMIESVAIVEKVQPEIIDINYGCPVKKVAGRGAGAGILCDIPKMEMMTREVVKASSLPVTAKTRLGWDDCSIRIVEVALRLQDAGIKGLTIHGRTRAQMYKGVADWEPIHEVASHPDIEIPIFGNGDVNSPEKAHEMRIKYPNISGIMIGRGAIGNPWIFKQIKYYLANGTKMPEPSLAEKADMARRHLLLGIKWKGEKVAIGEMRRHYSNYFKGIPNFKPLRMKLVTSDDLEELLDTFSLIEENYPEPLSINS